jgi:hypothetical protein
MPELLEAYPFAQTAGGAKPIVWISLGANQRSVALPSIPAPGRMRSGLSPKAGRAVNFSDSQAVELQFLTRQGTPVGRPVTVVPELDPQLDDPIRIDAPEPWHHYEALALGQDFLEQFAIVLIGPAGLTGVFGS